MPSTSSSSLSPPKVLLFDIGGVCVVSPFRAILDYELSQDIPPGWVNFSISRSAPNGAWQRLERGEIENNAAFFDLFNADLHREDLWREHCAKAAAKQHATQEKDASANANTNAIANTIKPLPRIDGEWLFWEMMRISRTPDAHMLPALRKLKASKRYLVAALSNTSIFPENHPFSKPLHDDPAMDVKSIFDVFVSSAHVGLRKPDRKIYDLAMRMLREEYVRQGRGKAEELQEGDVVFLDDIGENLRTARAVGWRTVKVQLGRTRDAVVELEGITGLRLLEEGARL